MGHLIDLIIPPRCINCERIIPKQQHICVHCLNQLPYTHWHFDEENLINKNFKSLKKFLGGNALLYYQHGNSTFKILHANKYYNQPKVGKLLALLSLTALEKIHFEAVIPVPSHKHTTLNRGYTQTYLIAQTIAKHYKVPVYLDCIERTKRKNSQTRKTRIKRLLLPEEDFKCNYKIKEKYVLFIDDVITTGGTLKACIKTFNHKNDAGFYIFCIAQTD